MNNLIVQSGQAVRRSPVPAALLAVSCAFGAWQSVAANDGEWDSPLALLLLAALSAVHGLLQLPAPKAAGRWLSWGLLAAAVVLMGWSAGAGSEFGRNTALLLGVCATGAFFCGATCLAPMGFSLGLCFWVLPFLERITLFLSYPLRLLSTGLSVGLLRLFGVDIQARLTTISIGQTQLAITDACSGVSQLGVLLFFAYLLALKLPERPQWQTLVWGLFILPIVVLANTVRLLLTIGLFFWLGERSFANDIHVGLGYFFVLLSLALLWWSGRLLFYAPGEKR
ncbi:MAG: exosortase/archaeosortase family protein [Lentisphaeria bacterium]